MADKHARVSWKGDLENGSGTIEQVGSGAFGPLAVSWAARTGDEGGMTSPEELIAAAHASCFSMAFSARLAKAGTPPDRLEVSATVTFVPGEGITTSALEVTGVVPGITEESFVAARRRREGELPGLGRAEGQRRNDRDRQAGRVDGERRGGPQSLGAVGPADGPAGRSPTSAPDTDFGIGLGLRPSGARQNPIQVRTRRMAPTPRHPRSTGAIVSLVPLICPECSTSNPDEARFCLHCGTRLDSATDAPAAAGATAPACADDAPAHLEPFLPRGMLSKLEAARAGRAMEGERRVVTMLFCDVKGSTAMAERLDPEEWAEIMNGAFEHLIAPIYRYEGTLARLMGDAIFAFFGAPIAHEDDPQRAVSAGLDIIDGIQAYRERQRADRGLDLNVRVGINTGPVVVGQVGSDLRLEYTAMGDAVNVAARMEQTAEPGTVQITAETYRRIASSFDAESARRGRGQGEDGAGARVPGRRPEATAGDALTNARHPARRPRARDGDPHARDRRRARGSRPDRVADRRGRSGQEPVDRGDTAGMGEASTRRRPAQHLGRPADLGDVAVRFLRHDTALRAVSPDAGPDRRDRRHRPAGRRAGEVGTDHRLLRGVGGTSHARLARTVRCAGTRRRAARGGGVQGRDHGTGPGIDPPLRAPHLGSWCSRTSIGATRRRWTC